MIYNVKELDDSIEDLRTAKTQKRHRRAVFILKLSLLLILAGLIGASYAAVNFVRSAIDEAPDLDILNSNSSGYSSRIYDSDGILIQTLSSNADRQVKVSYEDIPQNLINAFVATEDFRYWQHNGVDIKALLRSAYIGLTTGTLSDDGSTISQQLIKNNVLDVSSKSDPISRLRRKIEEQYLAIELEKKLDKNIILEYYLNSLNFGIAVPGIGAASEHYFGKDVSSLTLSECTVLAATAANPSQYNPVSHPDDNSKQRLSVLKKMKEREYISDVEMEEALKDDVYSRIQTAASNDSEASDEAFSYFVDEVYEQVSDHLQTILGYSPSQAYQLLHSEGLQIYTTLDRQIQSIVDEEVNNPDNYYSVTNEELDEFSLKYSLTVRHENGSLSTYNEKNITAYFQSEKKQATFRNIYSDTDAIDDAIREFRSYILSNNDTVENETIEAVPEPQASVVVIEQSTGHVLAVSGGRGEKKSSLSLDRATSSARQPGSVLSILSVFTPALDTFGATLATTYYDASYNINDLQILDWWGTQYLGYNNIRQAITYSMNVVTAKCLNNLVSYSTAFDYLNSWHISTLSDSDKSASLALGSLTDGVTNEELTAAYAAIANDGIYNEPIYYTKVLDRNGNTLLEEGVTSSRVIKSSTAALLTSAMEDTISSDSTLYYQYGITPTGRTCAVDGIALAGKSGQAADGCDRWFVGYSPYYTAGLWSGYDDEKALSSGTEYYKVIWQHIMARIHDGLEAKDFTFSDELETALICSKSGLLAIDGVCTNDSSGTCEVYEESFVPGTAPTEYCDRHYTLRICSKSGKSATEYCPEDDVVQKIYFKIDDTDLSSGTTTDTSLLAPSNLQSCDVHSSKSNQ